MANQEDGSWTFSDDDWVKFLQNETAQHLSVDLAGDGKSIDQALDTYLATESPKVGRLLQTLTLRDRLNQQISFIQMDRPIPHELDFDNQLPLYLQLKTQRVPEIHPFTDDFPEDFAFAPRFAEYIDIHTPDHDAFTRRFGAQRIQKISVGIHNDAASRAEANAYMSDHPLGFDFQTLYFLTNEHEGSLIKVASLPNELEDDRVNVMPETPDAKHVLSPLSQADRRIVERILGHFVNLLESYEESSHI